MKCQTLYTQITHKNANCSGCINVTYEAGDDGITATCNQCGADLLTSLVSTAAVPREVLNPPGPKYL